MFQIEGELKLPASTNDERGATPQRQVNNYAAKKTNPTKEEKQQLIDYLLRDEDPEVFDEGKFDSERRVELEEYVEQAAIAVFDNYITDSVGYAGRVMVVLWRTGPEYTQTYTWYTHGGKEYLAKEMLLP